MKISAIIGGLTILKPYYKDGDGYKCGADHDVIYAYATDRPVSPEDVKRLRALDWFQEEVPDNDDDSPGEYDPEESWAAYV